MKYVWLLACFFLAITVYAQDPGPPVLTIDPEQDIQYRLNGQGDWVVTIPTEVIILNEALPGPHKWTHRRTNPLCAWAGELSDHTPENPHIAKWVIDLSTIQWRRFFDLLEVRWRARVYAGTEYELVAGWSEPNRIYVIHFGPLMIPIHVTE